MVELIIVVTLLIVIAGIFSVNFIKNLNRQKELSINNIFDQVIASASAYVTMYPSAIEDLYDGFAFVDIPVGILRDNGLLSEKITDPSTGENIDDDEIVRVRFGVYDNLEFEFPVEDKDLTDDSWILIAQTLYLDKSDNPVNWCAVEENIYTGLVTDKSLINTIKSKLYLMNRKGELAENIYRTEEVDLKAKSCNVDVTKEGNYYIDYTFKDPSTFQQKEKRRNVVVKNTSSNEGNDGEGNENGDEIIATFDPNGGSVVTNKKIRKLNQSYGELPLPTKDNYNFTGWYPESSGGELITADTKITNTEDHTLYAH